MSVDELEKKIHEKMKREGKVKIDNFANIVKNYFKNKYDKDGCFEFLYVEYEFFDKDYEIFNLDIGKYVSRPQNRKIRTLLPFFIESNSFDPRRFTLIIPGIINIEELHSEINKLAPKEITFITDNQMNEILYNEGYEDIFIDHFFYSIMEYPGYNIYAKPILYKQKYNINAVDSKTNSQLEQAYQNGKMKPKGIIDTENFPQNIPDEDVCQILDELLLKNQLVSRKVKYCYSVDPMKTTEYLYEYSWNNRKFIRYQANINNDAKLSNNEKVKKNKFYWVEVKSSDIVKRTPFDAYFTDSNKGRKL